MAGERPDSEAEQLVPVSPVTVEGVADTEVTEEKVLEVLYSKVTAVLLLFAFTVADTVAVVEVTEAKLRFVMVGGR